jgi:hypothetical protein
MSKPVYNKDWVSFTEHETVWPFARSDKAFDATAIRLSAKSDWQTDTIVEPENEIDMNSEDFAPEVQLNIDTESLLSNTGLDAADILISVHATDPAMKRSYPLASSQLDELKEAAAVSIPESLKINLSLRRGLTVSVVAHSNSNKNGYDQGDRVAEKEFLIRAAAEMSVSFPIHKMDPDDEKWPTDKYSKDTAWFIWWGERTSMFDYDAPMEAVMRVYFNERVHDHLDRLQKKGDTAHKMFWSQVSTEIFLEVATVYLSSGDAEEPDDASVGFRAKFVRSLKKLWSKTPGIGKDVSCAELVKQFKEDPDFISKLRAVMQQRANFRALAENIPA